MIFFKNKTYENTIINWYNEVKGTLAILKAEQT